MSPREFSTKKLKDFPYQTFNGISESEAATKGDTECTVISRDVSMPL